LDRKDLSVSAQGPLAHFPPARQNYAGPIFGSKLLNPELGPPDLVRQTVCWVGTEIAPGEYGDPLELVRRAQGSDPEQESLFALLEALDDVFASRWFTAREACQRASRARTDYSAPACEKALAEALADIGGERLITSTTSVGRILQFRQGRIVFGLRLLSRSGRSGREYRIEAIGDPARCGFSGFSGFESGQFETGSEATSADSKRAKTNPPNPPNPQTVRSDLTEGW
jgi:hypothetical protein